MFADSTSHAFKGSIQTGFNPNHSSQSPYPRTTAVQSPTISNSERVDSFTRTGNRRIDKGERERKRVADIRRSVETVRKRIPSEFLKGSNAKKPTRVQTLKDAICYICSLSKVVYGKQWTCRCTHVTGMAHRDIRPTPSSIDPSRSLRPYDPKNLLPHQVLSSNRMPHQISPTHPPYGSSRKSGGSTRGRAEGGPFSHTPLNHHHIPNYC